MESLGKKSCHLALRMDAQNVAIFRFLLEARDNLAFFSVPERRPALLMLVFANESREEVVRALEEIGETVPLTWEEWMPAERDVQN